MRALPTYFDISFSLMAYCPSVPLDFGILERGKIEYSQIYIYCAFLLQKAINSSKCEGILSLHLSSPKLHTGFTIYISLATGICNCRTNLILVRIGKRETNSGLLKLKGKSFILCLHLSLAFFLSFFINFVPLSSSPLSMCNIEISYI